MSDYWYDEDYQYEPEPEIELPDSQKVEVGLSINAGLIENAIQRHIDEILEPRIKRAVKKAIDHNVKGFLATDNWSKESFKDLIITAIERRMIKLYPEVVENKVNEFYKFLKEAKYRENTREFHSIRDRAAAKVDEYIEKELVESVKRSKDYIEQFSKNYFANNLFKAMGMMEKMMPATRNILDKDE